MSEAKKTGSVANSTSVFDTDEYFGTAKFSMGQGLPTQPDWITLSYANTIVDRAQNLGKKVGS